jgi:NADPH-dependent curcumin reductase
MGPRVEGLLIVKRVTMRGFLVLDHQDRYADAVAQIRGWIRGGQLRRLARSQDCIEAKRLMRV